MANKNNMSKFQPITSMPIYTKANINFVLSEIKRLPKGIQRTAFTVYSAIEMHCNKDLEAFVGQACLAKELDLTREYICKIIAELCNIGLIKKIRVGLNQVNRMVLTKKKEFMEALAELRSEQQEINKQKNEEKQNQVKKSYLSDNYKKNYKGNSKNGFTDNIETSYGSIGGLEKLLLGKY